MGIGGPAKGGGVLPEKGSGISEGYKRLCSFSTIKQTALQKTYEKFNRIVKIKKLSRIKIIKEEA